MANIPTSINEQVFTIKNWLGVNQAEEGEARLKNGEAAEMRNFKITSGGALRKRAGSKNVAGLLSEYIAETESNIQLCMTEAGIPYEYPAYGTIGTDTVGTPIGTGEESKVNFANHGDYENYYIAGDTLFRLSYATTVKATGAEAVNGGAVNIGALTGFASGTYSKAADGTVSETGTQNINCFSELTIDKGAAVGSGEETIKERVLGEVGWTEENVGGFMLLEDKPYKYYGLKIDAAAPLYALEKFACTRNTSYYTYYSLSSWTQTSSTTIVEGTQIGPGGTSYSVNSSTGAITTSGSKTLTISSPGTIYGASGTSITRITVSSSGVCTFYSASSVQRTGSSTSYSVGDLLGTLPAASWTNPEGYTYVTTSGNYRIFENGGTYYAYLKVSDTITGGDYSFTWYGYPLTLVPDTYSWYGYKTYSYSNESTPEVRGIWSGFVAGREVLCAACGGQLWELSKNEDGTWSKLSCGTLSTEQRVYMFGFEEKLYILNGSQYKVWDGMLLVDVEGYRPMVATEVLPTGGGTPLEQANKLCPYRRCRFSPDGTATAFQLPETGIASVDYVTDLTTGDAMEFTADLEAGTVTFGTAPTKGVDSIEIGWSAATDDSESVRKMRFAELFNGAQDSRVFIYGDGSNQAFYSGLDYNGKPRADYFPDLNVAAIGDANTPIMAMIRHYNRLLAFKLDSTYSMYYSSISTADGITIPGFYVSTVNRDIGCCAIGQACLVENRPRTLDGRSVIEWKATSTSGNITGDSRNAQRVSQRVDQTIRSFDLSRAETFYDKINHEYYVIGAEGTALVHNIEADAWYIYTGFDALCLINYRDELYYGTADGYLRHFSHDYTEDEGEVIDAYWESGSMAFSADFRRKYSAMIWVGIKPEDNGYLAVTAQTDKKSEFAEYSFTTDSAEAVPTMHRMKLKAKKFTYYKLILRSNQPKTTATVVSCDMRVRETGYVR